MQNNANVTEWKHALGSSLIDNVSGFTGVCTSRHEYEANRRVYGITTRGLNKDGEPITSQLFDEERLRG